MENRALFDMHNHTYRADALPFFRDYLDRAGLSGLCVASYGCFGDGFTPEQLLLPMFLKRKEKRIYACGSLLYPEGSQRTLRGKWAPEKQARRLLDMGFDGWKLLESKPGFRKMLGLPLDSPVLDPLFGLLEAGGCMVVWHVADPPEFWDLEKAPDFAVREGWTYTNGTYLPYEALIGEALHVLERHPKLRVTFAHFFFHSHDLTAAAEVMERYPAVSFDLTPGIEMYQNFSKAPDAWRKFFIRYADRLLLGTDTDEHCECVMCDTEKDPVITVSHIRRFLETDEDFLFWGRPVHGLGLPEAVLEKIYCENFRSRIPKRREVNAEALRAFAAEMLPRIRDEEVKRLIAEELRLPE